MDKQKKGAQSGNSEFKVNVMMIGGRRCGKTSVLAAMQDSFNKKMSGTSFRFDTADGTTVKVLGDKISEIKEYFTVKGHSPTFVPDDTPTKDISTYSFNVGLQNSKSKIKIGFIDLPGEWVVNHTHDDEIMDNMSKSRVLIIAIDTPHLMEENGRFNERRNHCYDIIEMVKRVGFADSDKGAGLILLIPLKCERYYNDKRMEEVLIKVKEAYSDLIQYINQPGVDGKRSPCQVAVTPIRTMGGAAFEKFERDENFEIKVDPSYKTPEKAIYYFPDMNVLGPEPADCEQPVLYVLDFTLRAVQSVKKRSKLNTIFVKIGDMIAQALSHTPNDPLFSIIANFIAEAVKKWPGAEDYLPYADKIAKMKKTEGDGYKILIG